MNKEKKHVEVASDICSILQSKGYIAYFAGGYVRDLLLKIDPQDIDIATDALPEEIALIFPNYISVGAQFGVLLVRYEGHQFEVATFRRDLVYENGRKPKAVILKSTPEEDAQRRDFTINGMFFDPTTKTIIDFVGGKKDLEQRVIRTIGSPYERFQEDRLRMIRAIRFQNRFLFAIEETTKTAIQQLAHSLLPSVSVERIYLELQKIHEYGHLPEALQVMHELQILQVIFPSVCAISSQQIADRVQHLSEHTEYPLIFILATLLQDDTTLVQTIEFLHGTNEDKQWALAYMEVKKLMTQEVITPYEWVKIFSDKKKKPALSFLSIQKDHAWKQHCEAKQRELEPYIHRMETKNPLIRAKDLQKFHIQPGITMGKLLKEAEKISINSKIDDKTSLLEKLQELYEDDFQHPQPDHAASHWT